MAGVIAAQSREVADLVDDLLTAERAASGNLTIRAAPDRSRGGTQIRRRLCSRSRRRSMLIGRSW